MRAWIPLLLAAALLAVPPAAAQQKPDARLDTSTTLRTGAGLALAPGEAGAVETEVVYRHRPVPATSTTPTHLSVAEAPPDLKMAFSPSTVHHEVRGPLDSGTTQTSVQTATLTILASEDAEPGAHAVLVEGFSEQNGAHNASQGQTQVLVKVDETASSPSTQAVSAAPAADAPVGALAGLLGVGALAAAALALHRRDP